MITRIAVALSALVASGLMVSSGPVAAATAGTECTPSIAMDTPYQTSGGMVYFPASYTSCASSKVTVKFRDRGTTDGWGKSGGVGPATTSTMAAGFCAVGDARRFVAYATIKTPTGGTILAKSQKVYFTSSPVKRNCTD